MTKYLIFTISALIIVLLLALCPQNISTESKAFAQLLVPNTTTDSLATSNNNATITIHISNSIQGNNFVIKHEEPVIRKAILSNIDNVIFIAKGSVKSAIPVNINAKIINQLANSRVDTTQGIDITKKLIATELINAINATTTGSNAPFHFVQQPTKEVVIAADNQAICTGIASPTKAACSFTINIHG
ncbi:MAG: hypothetical protein WA364_08450 [Candidatus Nitrosopolaris sp.]